MVYHYCNLDTFLKIIQNKSLRLSDIGKSNDYTELIYIQNIIREEFEKKIQKLTLKDKERNLWSYLWESMLCRKETTRICTQRGTNYYRYDATEKFICFICGSISK